jgi:hypothetical protein
VHRCASLHHWAISAACVNRRSATSVGSKHTAPASHPLTVPQGQIVFLAQCGDSILGSRTEARLGVLLVPVHLADDLCGTVSIGDRVLATGCGRYYGGSGGMAGPQAGQVPQTLGVKVGRPGCWQSWVLDSGSMGVRAVWLPTQHWICKSAPSAFSPRSRDVSSWRRATWRCCVRACSLPPTT